MSDQVTELSTEQLFAIRAFEVQVYQMSHQQAQQFLIMLHKQMMIRDATYKNLLKHQWGVSGGEIGI